MTYDMARATVYDFPYSSSSYRLRIALSLKGVAPASIETVNLRTGDHLAAAFVKRVGASVVPAVDFGDMSYTQSLALIEWLDAVYPQPALIPADPSDALKVRSAALTVACDIHPLNVPRVLKYLADPAGLSEEERRGWYRHWVREGFAVLERQLVREQTRGAFCVGNRPTLADICLVPQVLNARRFGVDVEDFKRIGEIYDRCLQDAAFQNAAPPSD